MSLKFSQVIEAAKTSHGGNFSVHRLDTGRLAGFIEPIVGFDHFRMSGPTFAPHPHAGFSAVSYLFQDSAGALRNRDSLGHDLVVEPGGLVWTQTGSGVIHEEFPAENGREVHGLQLFVNLGSRYKSLAPQVFHIASPKVPALEDDAGNRIRVLSGQIGSAEPLISPISPAEPFDFLDASLSGQWIYRVPRDRNVLVYVLAGEVLVAAGGGSRSLAAHQAVGIRGQEDGLNLRFDAATPSHLLVLSGTDPREPVAQYGPFIMNTRSELEQAYERYRDGLMGRLAPLSDL